MPITTDTSHPEFTRTSITPAGGERRDVSATVTAHAADRNNSSVLSFTLRGDSVVDLTRAEFARHAEAHLTDDGRTASIDAAHAGPALARLGLNPALKARIEVHYQPEEQEASLTITSLEVGAQAPHFGRSESQALIKAMALQTMQSGNLMLPAELRGEIEKQHPELVVKTAQQGTNKSLTIAAEALHFTGMESPLTVTATRQGGLQLKLDVGADQVLAHLKANGVEGRLSGEETIELARGTSAQQALAALAKPAAGQPPLIDRQIADYATTQAQSIKPPTVFAAVSRVVGALTAPATETPDHSPAMQQALAQARGAEPKTPVALAETHDVSGPQLRNATGRGTGIG